MSLSQAHRETESGKNGRDVINLAILSYTISMSDRLLMSIVVIPMSLEYSWELSTQGFILSSFGAGYIMTQVVGGVAAKRFGSRTVLPAAVFAWSIATLCTPLLAWNTGLLLSVRILLGIGEGFTLPCIYQLLSEVPADEQSTYLSRLYAAGALGNLLSLVLCPLLRWRISFYLFGSLGIVWVIIFVSLASPYKTKSMKKQFLTSKHDIKPMKKQLQQALICKPLWAVIIAHSTSNCFAYTLSLWLPKYLHERFNVSKGELSVTAVPYGVNLLLGPCVGYAIDKYGPIYLSKLRQRQFATSIALVGQAFGYMMLCYVASTQEAILCVSFAVFCKTFCSGGWEASHNDIAPSASGTTYGISNTAATVPSVVLGPLVAFILENGGDWCTLYKLVSFLGLLGAVTYHSWIDTFVHID